MEELLAERKTEFFLLLNSVYFLLLLFKFSCERSGEEEGLRGLKRGDVR